MIIKELRDPNFKQLTHWHSFIALRCSNDIMSMQMNLVVSGFSPHSLSYVSSIKGFSKFEIRTIILWQTQLNYFQSACVCRVHVYMPNYVKWDDIFINFRFVTTPFASCLLNIET